MLGLVTGARMKWRLIMTGGNVKKSIRLAEQKNVVLYRERLCD